MGGFDADFGEAKHHVGILHQTVQNQCRGELPRRGESGIPRGKAPRRAAPRARRQPPAPAAGPAAPAAAPEGPARPGRPLTSTK